MDAYKHFPPVEIWIRKKYEKKNYCFQDLVDAIRIFFTDVELKIEPDDDGDEDEDEGDDDDEFYVTEIDYGVFTESFPKRNDDDEDDEDDEDEDNDDEDNDDDEDDGWISFQL